jgi:hypothetical protein
MFHELAQVYHISPLEIRDRWSEFDQVRFLTILHEERAGRKLKAQIDEFMGGK